MSNNINIQNLKNLIDEYDELYQELEDMTDDWENGSPEAAAMSDPSDQYMKGQEIEEKYAEIKTALNDI